MDMETPVWLIAIFAVLAVLVWIALELRHQRKNPGSSHYVFDQKRNTVVQTIHKPQDIYDQTRDLLKKNEMTL